MNMKLSYRDKVIFIVVMVIIVFVAGFFLLIKPKFESVDVAKYNLEAKKMEWSEVETKINTYPTIVSSMKEAAKTIKEKQTIFMEEAHPYLNERYIRDSLATVNVELFEVTTDYTVAGDISRYIVDEKNLLVYDNKIYADLYNELPQEIYDEYNGVEREEYPAAIIGITKMTFGFETGHDLKEAYAVIDQIAADEKTIILNSISSEPEQNSSEPTEDAKATITLYSIQPLNVDKVLEDPDTIDEAVKLLNEQPAAEAVAE